MLSETRLMASLIIIIKCVSMKHIHLNVFSWIDLESSCRLVVMVSYPLVEVQVLF